MPWGDGSSPRGLNTAVSGEAGAVRVQANRTPARSSSLGRREVPAGVLLAL